MLMEEVVLVVAVIIVICFGVLSVLGCVYLSIYLYKEIKESIRLMRAGL